MSASKIKRENVQLLSRGKDGKFDEQASVEPMTPIRATLRITECEGLLIQIVRVKKTDAHTQQLETYLTPNNEHQVPDDVRFHQKES